MQNSPEKGWRAFETTRNRFWLAENLNNPVFKPMRDFTYTYHRKGLDIMTDKRDDAISMITFGLESLKKLHNDKPNSHLMQIIFFTKADELVNVFSQAFPDVKAKVVTTLNEIDPANGIKYDAILNRN
jgi:hypothetical protein